VKFTYAVPIQMYIKRKFAYFSVHSSFVGFHNFLVLVFLGNNDSSHAYAYIKPAGMTNNGQNIIINEFIHYFI